MTDEASALQKLVGFGWRTARRIRRRLGSSGHSTKPGDSKKKLYSLTDDSVLSTFAPGIEQLAERFQQDDRPIVVGPWVSELGFEVLYWIPFVKWFVERYSIAPDRLIFVSRGGMQNWYNRPAWNGASTYCDIFSVVSPDEYRQMNTARWQRSGNQKQPDVDPAETRLIRMIASKTGIESHHRLHPSVMYNFFVVFWTHGKRLGLGAELVLKHAIYEPLFELPKWSGPALPDNFVAVKFYSRTSLPHSDETAGQIERLILQIAETRPVISLDTTFRADDHSAFALPVHPNITSARDWMTPENNLDLQTRLIADSDFFVGTYGGTSYLPVFANTPSVGLYSANDLNLAHQLLAMRACRSLGQDVTLMRLRDCCHLFDIVAGKR
ncbi:hypothetical protein [Oricola nitratireducens]|uniref:hypothetical protein n=1 Tax=Oricola nitratireducens TaxID=2775868 RepID=UPI00186604D7|nr:hypothetical protein [Oricola nitratireducens]